MGFINAEMRLCDVITNEPSLIPVDRKSVV